MSRTTTTILRAGLMAATLALPSAAWAQQAGAAPAPADANAPAAPAQANGEQVSATLRTEGGRRVYVASTTIEVRGEIQRPYAFSVSGRSSLGYTYFDQPIHFLREILDAVRRAPF
ncbi:MAG: hypothetical protein U0325_09990 [Polyangiales bacterium]